ncbi:DUF4365 domain-containing protein [Methanosarcina sp. DH2]|jgi:hypothetical protein|uniref:DUF4365 domain-containing protein n=1 Tax=Methanosarcina sp. DH2 TaxID=2605639 RepID=UPI001E5E96F0|nr:DUF4365 domain-containing protein [Methanosarcina sp. DH2]MCC4771047.1 DUF4365 domain-containing protein [Methanosarcina sp. DH2]
MITMQHSEEFLSIAAMNAIAAMAGVELECRATHDYGIDGTIREIRDFPAIGKVPGLTMDYQLKSTVNWNCRKDFIIYNLEVKNYNKMVIRFKDNIAKTPYVLILLCLPKKRDEWLSISPEEIILRKCCYWYEVSADDDISENEYTITIKIPKNNIFLPETISKMFEYMRCGDEM